MPKNLAVVLLSGGLDSSTVLRVAITEGFDPLALTFDYGQLHVSEIEAARTIAASCEVREHRLAKLDLRALGGSALTDSALAVPIDRAPVEIGSGIPVTYVPARNLLFLSYALAFAEVRGAGDIFIGANHLDSSGYPDCRPEFLDAFERVANLGTRAGTEGDGIRIHAPLIELNKADIVLRGVELGVDFGMTRSCYEPEADGRACGGCDACQLRLAGFADAGVTDPAPYVDGCWRPDRDAAEA